MYTYFALYYRLPTKFWLKRLLFVQMNVLVQRGIYTKINFSYFKRVIKYARDFSHWAVIIFLQEVSPLDIFSSFLQIKFQGEAEFPSAYTSPLSIV